VLPQEPDELLDRVVVVAERHDLELGLGRVRVHEEIMHVFVRPSAPAAHGRVTLRPHTLVSEKLAA
jgi:hypothetical protein